MARKQKRKLKPKSKSKKTTQKQKQTQRTTVTVNIVGSKRAPRASAKSNTNRVLAQYAQPLITLPSNLINPPPIPSTTGLNVSSLQRGTNQGLTGNILGEDLAERERIKALREGLSRRSSTTRTPSWAGEDFSDTLRNYIEPEQSLSGFESSIASPFTVGTASSASSDVSRMGLSAGAFEPFEKSLVTRGRPKKQLVRVRAQPILSTEPPADTGVPSAGSPAIRAPDPRVVTRLVMKKEGGEPMKMLPKRTTSDIFPAGTEQFEPISRPGARPSGLGQQFETQSY